MPGGIDRARNGVGQLHIVFAPSALVIDHGAAVLLADMQLVAVGTIALEGMAIHAMTTLWVVEHLVVVILYLVEALEVAIGEAEAFVGIVGRNEAIGHVAVDAVAHHLDAKAWMLEPTCSRTVGVEGDVEAIAYASGEHLAPLLWFDHDAMILAKADTATGVVETGYTLVDAIATDREVERGDVDGNRGPRDIGQNACWLGYGLILAGLHCGARTGAEEQEERDCVEKLFH